MKKLLALVLAFALSLSMASAILADEVNLQDGSAFPGDEIKIPLEMFNSLKAVATDKKLPTIDKSYLSTDYFTIKVEYSRGKELVKEVKFYDEGVKIVLKDDVLESPSVPNFQIKSVTLTGKKDGVNKSTENFRGKKYELKSDSEYKADYTAKKLTEAFKVGYPVITTAHPVGKDIDAKNSQKQIWKLGENDETNKTYDVTFIDFGVATAEVRLYKDEKFFFGTSATADLDIVKANPDADLEFLTFKGNPTFSSNAYVEIIADEDTFLYEIKDGKLVESKLKYDEDAGAFTGKVRSLGKFVISDMKLVNAATVEETKNPDTGR